ncbi:hypothetical protein CPC08DRAFT_302352 [Agrocybe pediades]|nr:hypothetical protein CPC08DRAFT_302352 [Agrocybe pediades]
MAPIDYTLGAGSSGCLYGVTSVQTFLYFHDFKEDSMKIKTMVFVLWILDTIHLIFACHGLYIYLVTNYGNFESLLEPTWTILAQVYVTSLSDLIVRGFFSRRVFVLCVRRNKLLAWALPTIIITLALIVLASGFGFASRSFVLKTYKRMNEAAAMLYASLACAVAADTIIAASLCTLLLKSRTGFKRTNSTLTTLMAFSINTGLLTTVCAIACLVTYAIWPQRFVFIGIYFALSKLYVNSLLASLNARTAFRSGKEVDFDMSFGMSTSNRRVSANIAFPNVKDSSQGTGTHGSETSTYPRISDLKVSGFSPGPDSV